MTLRFVLYFMENTAERHGYNGTESTAPNIITIADFMKSTFIKR